MTATTKRTTRKSKSQPESGVSAPQPLMTSHAVTINLRPGTRVNAREVEEDSEWAVGTIEAIAPWGVLVRDDNDVRFAAVWDNIEILPEHLTPAEFAVTDNHPAHPLPVLPGQTIEAEDEPGCGCWTSAEVVSVHGTHVVIKNNDGSTRNVSWMSVKLYPLEVAAAMSGAA